MRILALTKYGMMAASARQRFGLYQHQFAKAGIELQFSPLFSNAHVANLASGRVNWLEMASGYARRMRALAFEARAADALWVHCETFPYLPSIFETIVHRLNKPVIFDYDDAIFHMYDRADRPVVRALLREKLRPIIKGSACVLAGNAYLADYARQWNDRVLIVPTVVDTDKVRPAEGRRSGPPVIGWIGSASTWPYVRPYLPLLRRLIANGDARVLVVGAGREGRIDEGGGIEFRDWSEQREIADLQDMDIGIMPVPDRPWERGKSGYKLIQYMASGLPCVASPVGVNREIVKEGETGFLANSLDEWEAALDSILASSKLRKAMGKAGRERAVEHYSLRSQAPRLIDLFSQVGGR